MFQYTSSFEFFRRVKEKSYDKFNDIAVNLFNVATVIPELRENLVVVIMNHLEIETDGFGGSVSKIKTIGSMVDKYLVVEGLFTVVLYTHVDPENKDLRYGFLTKNDGTNTVKTPEGMFDDDRIPNDLAYVVDRVNAYNQ